MRKQWTHLGSLLCLSALFITSCQDFNPVDEVDFHTELAIPLVHNEVSIQQALDARDDLSEIDVAADGTLVFRYSEDAYDIEPEGAYQQQFDFPFAFTDPDTEIDFDPFEAIELKSAMIQHGTLEFDLTSDLTEDVDVLITLPDLIKNGQAFQTQIELIYSGSTPTNKKVTGLDVSGYELKISQGMINLSYEAKNKQGQPVDLQAVLGLAREWQLQTITGIAERRIFGSQRDTIRIDLFDDWSGGSFEIADPRLRLSIGNSIGLPMMVRVQTAWVETTSGEKIIFETNIPDAGFAINYPSLNQIGTVEQTEFIFNRENSNFSDMLNARPKAFSYVLEYIFNPDNTTEPGFITADSKITAGLDLEIPAIGSVKNFVFENEADIDLGEIEEVTHAEFKMTGFNEIPLEVDVQVEFVDENGQVLDALFSSDQTILPASQVDAQGNTSAPTPINLLVNFDEDRLNKIRSVSQLRSRYTIRTSEDGNLPVRISAEQKVGINLGVRFGVQPK